MAKNKYYAIKKGKETGIFNLAWGDILPLVQGVSGAVYKGFPKKEEAENWFNETDNNTKKIEADENTLIAYVDGSSSMQKEHYGCGVVLIFPDEKTEEIYYSGKQDGAKEMKNVAGELSSAMTAMKEARVRGFSNLILCHDYEGIAKYCTKEWKARKEMTQRYVEWYEINIKPYVTVEFKKVKGHSGDVFNDLADSLAKKAMES